MMSGGKTAPEVKLAAAVETGNTMSGTHVATEAGKAVSRRDETVLMVLRLLTVVVSVIALSFMVTARQDSVVTIYGFQLPVHSKWSYSQSFEYLVGVTAAVAAHSLIQLVIGGSRLLRQAPSILSRKRVWLILAADQVFAYAMMSAGSAASGTTNLNRTGIKHTALPDFCKAVQVFCNHVAVSVAFTFFGCVLLAVSALQEVIWLTKH